MAGTVNLQPVTDFTGLDMKPLQAYEKGLRKYVDKGKIPGYCSAVIWKGQLLHLDSYGMADPDRKLKYGPNVLMRLYCMSKPFVAVGILILQDRGLLSIKDPVSKYIPAFRNVALVANSDSVFTKSKLKPKVITLAHLVTHTAGLPYGASFNETPESAEEKMCDGLVTGAEDGSIKHLGQFVDMLAELPLRLKPGEEYHYSYGPDVLGRVIEVVSGMKLGQFLKKEIFQPLKMRDTFFAVPKNKANRLAALYASRTSAIKLGQKASTLPRSKTALCRIDGKKPSESRWYAGKKCCKIESGGGFQGANMGGLVSTVSDSARFMAMISNGGILEGVRILQGKTVQNYCYPDLFPAVITNGKTQRSDGKPFGWSALGEVGMPRTGSDPPLDPKEDFEVGETGGGGAACTYWSLNPNRDLAILWFTQSMDNDPYVKENENIYVAARKACPLSRRPAPSPVRKVGKEKQSLVKKTAFQKAKRQA